MDVYLNSWCCFRRSCSENERAGRSGKIYWSKAVHDALWLFAFAGILCDMAIFQVLLQEPTMHYGYAQTYNNIVNLSGPVPFAADPKEERIKIIDQLITNQQIKKILISGT